MSYTKMKLLSAVLLIFLVSSASVLGQTTGMRFFSPYQSDQFGGGRRAPEGVFGEVSYTYRTLPLAKDSFVGHSVGREVYTTSGAFMMQKTNMNTGSLSESFSSGVYAELGNIQGRHGWFMSGYSSMAFKSDFSGRNGTMSIYDPLTVKTLAHISADENVYYDRYYDGLGGFKTVANNMDPIVNIGHLWGWYPKTETRNINGEPTEVTVGYLAPLPVNFDRYTIQNKANHWSVDLNYMYRCSSTWFGMFEIFGGPRYVQIDDTFSFSGIGSPWADVNIVTEYEYEEDEDGKQYIISSDTYLQGTASGPGSIFGNASWKQQANNHIVAPQIGIKWTKRNARWSFSADTRLLLGINYQSMKLSGGVRSWDDSVWQFDGLPTLSEVEFDPEVITGMPTPWTPIGVGDNRNFNYNRHRTDFSPGIECKLTANWQWTNAVGIQFGFDMLWMDNIARGSRINNYSISDDGSLFGINSKQSLESIFSYGFRVGFTIHRF